jgi:hypothetical protein
LQLAGFRLLSCGFQIQLAGSRAAKPSIEPFLYGFALKPTINSSVWRCATSYSNESKSIIFCSCL